jgi:hypothetical protein
VTPSSFLPTHFRITEGRKDAVLADYSKLITTKAMLYTIAAILLVLWLLGVVTSYTLGGFIHLLLVIAIIAVLVRVIQGRSPVA